MTPLTFPGTGASLQSFEPERVDYLAPEAGGRLGGVQAGFPRWRAQWSIGRIGALRSDIWRAWVARLRGAQRAFYAADLARPYPLAHITGFAGMTRAGGGAFDGSATGWSETINADLESEVTLEGMPAELVLSIGDYIDFRWETEGAPRRALIRVVVGAEADGSGDITFKSEPPIPGVVPVDAAAHLDEPACLMKLDPETKLDGVDRRRAIKGGLISAVQELLP